MYCPIVPFLQRASTVEYYKPEWVSGNFIQTCLSYLEEILAAGVEDLSPKQWTQFFDCIVLLVFTKSIVLYAMQLLYKSSQSPGFKGWLADAVFAEKKRLKKKKKDKKKKNPGHFFCHESGCGFDVAPGQGRRECIALAC